MPAKLELSPKKRPSTRRGTETYQALITATARLLERGGYEALTTNHVAKRAGVGVASVYEFFPGKHALVAAVVDDTVERVLEELTRDLEQALAHADPVAEWIGRMFVVIQKRKRLFSVLVQEVPFFWQVASVRAARLRLRELSYQARGLSSTAEASPHTEAMTYLMPIMVAHAVLDSVIRPPRDLDTSALEGALIDAVKRLVG